MTDGLNISRDACIAYFSMEIGLEASIPTYSGGLGMLAGDTIRSAADLAIPMVVVSLVHRKGYFHQRLDETGWQTEEPVDWAPGDYLQELKKQVCVEIEGREVHIRAWKYEITGVSGFKIPVYLLDTDLSLNNDVDRTLTHYLYGGDLYYRLCQEVVLGIGGVKMLRALGHEHVTRFHMNEGHASLLILELLSEIADRNGETHINDLHVEEIKKLCVFTTHTPVPAGHDKFPLDLTYRVLGKNSPFCDKQEAFCYEGVLNMTHLALEYSHYVNGVAKSHKQTSQKMFGQHPIDSITNGVHVATWASSHYQQLFDQHIPGWREDAASLRYALNIPKEEIWQSHRNAKRDLLEYVNRETNAGMHLDYFTIGFARRATPYKRPDLIFHQLERLIQMNNTVGKIQIIFAGKAHPHDGQGKELIQNIHRIQHLLKGQIKLVYLEEYDMALGRLMTAGTDVWLNTPQPPMEASGTSGMKAAVNGVPSFSVLDGWWVEGCIEGVTGWAIGKMNGKHTPPPERDKVAAALYEKLESTILPMFYHEKDKYIEIMRHAIALNASFFNTERMLGQYITKAYFK